MLTERASIDLLTLSDSDQDGLMDSFSGSLVIASSLFWKRRRQQSIILMIRCGGLASLRTVAISAALIVLSASSASSRAGLAKANLSSAIYNISGEDYVLVCGC